MRRALLTLCIAFSTLSAYSQDWLIDGSSFKAEVKTSHDGKRLELTNGLMSRTFLLQPNLATIALDNLMTGASGLTNKAVVKMQNKDAKTYILARDYSITLEIEIPAKGYQWYVVSEK